MSRSSYHHGNLRRSLLDSGLELLAERGVDGFTLREVARRAGVSHAAPYHHFPDRAALVRALVAESFDLLGSGLAEAAAGAGDDPMARIGAMGAAYVEFAIEHPNRYRLMFRTDLSQVGAPETATDADAAGGTAFATLMAAVQDAADRGLLREGVDPGGAAVAAWSSVHGLASLVLEGALGVRPEQRERVRQLVGGVVAIVVDGLRRDDQPPTRRDVSGEAPRSSTARGRPRPGRR